MDTINHKFLNCYPHVISYYVDCILQSRMMLDEDLQLVIACWNPMMLSKKAAWNKLTFVSSTCATFGAVSSVKFKSLLPFTISFIPGIVQILQSLKSRYMENRYKNNIEDLLHFIAQLYELNQNIMEYCQKRNSAFHDNKNNEAYMMLLKPGEDILRTTILTEVKVLELLKSSVLTISSLVPVITTEYVHSLGWNFDEFKCIDDRSLKNLLNIFQKLNDLYVLVISSFLSCLGLSFCQQLWRSNSCNIESIFNSVIPELTVAFKLHTTDIKNKFNQIHFNLQYNKDEISRPQHSTKSSNEIRQLEKSLENVLFNLQVCFESGKHVHGLINQCNENVDLATHLHLVEGVGDQLNLCEDYMDIFIKSYNFLIKNKIENKVNPLTSALSSNLNIKKEIYFDDDAEEPIEDEEYNLSIHGSDEEDIIPFIEYTDQLPTEYLELMLHELKIKIKNRRRKHLNNKYDVEVECDSDQQLSTQELSFNSNSSVPAPPPLPSLIELSNNYLPVPGIPQLPILNESHLSVLDSVRTIAQSLNRNEEFQFGFNMFPEIPRPFNTTYSCFSVAMLPGNERQDVERGGKIIMPPSALEQLTRLNINYPMLFKITNKKTSRISHCGVLEFVADEGKVYLPLWMMHNLVLEEGDLIQIESVALPIGRFAKFQPLSIDFLDITNPKAVLENCLRTFACLTSGDVIAVKYNQRVYELCVLETQPGNAISIIECDMNVEFAAPVGYKESVRPKVPEEDMAVDPADLMPEPTGFVAFRGAGNRLDGKRRKDSGSADSYSAKPTYVRGIPDYDYEIGTLRFLRHVSKSQENNKEENDEFKAFSGEGFSLKQHN